MWTAPRSTFNIDPARIEERITSRTKAILVVHMCGRCCEMDPILNIARRYGLRVIEDCAHAIEAIHRGIPAGLMGDAGCFSFYPTKNIATGDGGMVITRDRQLYERVKVLSLHGMTADAWSRFVGGPTGYEVIAAGFKYNMTDLAAALALAAADNDRGAVAKARANLADLHRASERPSAAAAASVGGLTHGTPTICLRRCWISEDLGVDRQTIIAALDAENIGVGIHYVPVHQHPFYRQQFGFVDSDFPNAAFVGGRTISLPLSSATSQQDVDDVATALDTHFPLLRNFRLIRNRTSDSFNGDVLT